MNCCSNQQPPGQSPSSPKLGTARNLWIMFFYAFASSFTTANGASFLWYFTYLPFNYFILIGLFPTIPTTFFQMYLGYYGDKVDTRWGRRKPVIVTSMVVYLLSLLALANPPGNFINSSPKTLLWWATLWCIINYCAGIGLFMPLQSWFIESTADNDDFLKITTIPQNVGGLIGAIFGLVCSLFIPMHNLYWLICLILVVPAMTAMMYYVPNVQLREATKQPDLIPSLRTCMRSKEFRYVFMNKIVLFSAIGIEGSMLTFLTVVAFFPAIHYYSEIQIFIIVTTVALLILGLLVNASMSCVLAKNDKLKMYRLISYGTVALMLTLLITTNIPGFNGFIATLIINVLVALTAFPLHLIDGLFVRDLIVFDQFVTGLKRENMYQTALNLPSGLAQGVAINVAQAILFVSGFVSRSTPSNDDQIISRFRFDETSLWVMRILATVVAGSLVLLSNRIIKLYPLNDNIASKINNIVKERDEAKQDGNSIISSNNSMASKEENVSDNKPTRAPLTKQVSQPIVDETNEDIMYMNHLSGDEVKLVNSDFALLAQLKYKIFATIFLSVIACTLLFASIGLQVNTGQGGYAVLSMTLAVVIMLYAGYEGLRLVVIFKLGSMLEMKAKAIFKAAHENNNAFYSKMKNMLKDSGVLDADTGSVDADAGDVRMSLAMEDESDKTPENATAAELNIAGYKRTLFGLLIVIVYAGFGCTLLNVPQNNPDDHTPTAFPTPAPTF